MTTADGFLQAMDRGDLDRMKAHFTPAEKLRGFVRPDGTVAIARGGGVATTAA
jgi:hypothetical protein